jgi:hypothetical protein
MTPREKADELYSKYDDLLNKDFGNPIVFDNQIKQCALIAVDELIEVASDYCDYDETITKKYWEKVKTEIEKL